MLQRSPEWFAARAGRVTASRISDVLAKIQKGEAAGRLKYRRQLALERFYGVSMESDYQSFAMARGNAMEPEARSAYAFATGAKIEEVGFILHPGIPSCGASPDGLIEPGGGILEIKCPENNAMFEMLTKGALDTGYRHQVMWQMACTGRGWADVVFYAPYDMEIIRVDRDEQLIAHLEEEVKRFLSEVEADHQLLIKTRQK